ncbi:MAG TPA: Hsp20/alpha crystallin family protein [Blastocatellia bacterium]|nr:Hsp20/alpha crystallin family protein [Blastocatellia bacterium]
MQPGTAMAPLKSLRNLINTDPFFLLQNRLNRLTDFPLAPFVEETLPLTSWVPACDIYETEKEIVLKAELPGLKKEEVFVSIENSVLTIRGERKFSEEIKRENFHRVERSYGEFLRSFTLPTFIDATKILAEFKDGLLMVTLPKREEAKPKQIEVKVK